MCDQGRIKQEETGSETEGAKKKMPLIFVSNGKKIGRAGN